MSMFICDRCGGNLTGVKVCSRPLGHDEFCLYELERKEKAMADKDKVTLTKKDFNLFKSECQKWIERLGLISWDIYYEFIDMEDTYGTLSSNYTGRLATIRLSKTFPKPYENRPLKFEIKRTALHECLELLLSPLNELASDRNFSEDDYEKERHSVIRTLENILMEVNHGG